MRLLFTGDSITDCDHLWDDRADALGFGYVRMIREMICEQDEIINRGHDGFTAGRMLECWDADCIRFVPDVLTILVGVNDLFYELEGQGAGPELYEKRLKQLVIRAREDRKDGKPQLILMEPFLFSRPAEFLNYREPLARYGKAVKKTAQAFGAEFVPLAKILKEAEQTVPVQELTSDGIHPSEKGHRIIADAWMDAFGRGRL